MKLPRKAPYGIALCTLALALMPLIAEAQSAVPPTAVLTHDSIAAAANCLTGGGANDVVNRLSSLFSFSDGNGGMGFIGNTAIFYERAIGVVFAALFIVRMCMNGARESIDGFIHGASKSSLGPALLFAFGLFLASSLSAGSQNWVIGAILTKAETFGTTLGGAYAQNSSVADVQSQLNLTGALDHGQLGGIVKTGICTAEGNAFGVPPGTTLGAKAINLIAGILATLNTLLSGGPAAIISYALLQLVQGLTAIFVAFVFMRLMWEVFTVFLTKIFLLPLGVIFLPLAQLEFFGFFNEAYKKLVISTLIRVMMLSLFLPLFIGILIGGSIIATQDMLAQAASVGGADNMGVRWIDCLVIIMSAGFLQFFLGCYQQMGDQLLNGSSGISGEHLGKALGQAANATAGAVANGISKGISTAASLFGPTGKQSRGYGARSDEVRRHHERRWRLPGLGRTGTRPPASRQTRRRRKTKLQRGSRCRRAHAGAHPRQQTSRRVTRSLDHDPKNRLKPGRFFCLLIFREKKGGSLPR